MTRNYMKTATEIGSLVTEKNVAYGSSFERSGSIMSTLYPDGIQPEQMTDALAMVRVIDKMFRIATRKNAFDESPWNDIAGYGILMATLDAENREIEMYDCSNGPRIQWIDGDLQNDVVTDYNTGEDISLDDVHYTSVDPSTGEVKMSATPIVGNGETHVWQSDDGRCVDDTYFRRPPYFNTEETCECDCDCYDEDEYDYEEDYCDCGDYADNYAHEEYEEYDEECEDNCDTYIIPVDRSIQSEEERDLVFNRVDELIRASNRRILTAHEVEEMKELNDALNEWGNRTTDHRVGLGNLGPEQAMKVIDFTKGKGRESLKNLSDLLDAFNASKRK